MRSIFRKNTNLNHASGVTVTLEELISLRKNVILNPLDMHKVTLEKYTLNSLSKIRGRGLDFDATREYQAGDDVRRMAWRVTARSLKPQVKIYYEEKERPVWLGIDLSPSLYFGTRRMFKSVRSIKKAAYLGWSHLKKRERLGAFIATPNQTLVFKPQSRERDFLFVLKSLASNSLLKPAFTEKNCLHSLLSTMQQHVRAGNLIFIVSDFFEFNTLNKKLLMQMAKLAEVHLIFIYDQFEATPPPAYPYVLTDGQNKIIFNTILKQNREHFQQQFENKLKELIDFSRQYSLSLEVLRTDQE